MCNNQKCEGGARAGAGAGRGGTGIGTSIGGCRCWSSTSAKQALTEASNDDLQKVITSIGTSATAGLVAIGSSSYSTSSSSSSSSSSTWHDDHKEIVSQHDQLPLQVQVQVLSQLSTNDASSNFVPFEKDIAIGESSVPVPELDNEADLSDNITTAKDNSCDSCRVRRDSCPQHDDTSSLLEQRQRSNQLGKSYIKNKTTNTYTMCDVRQHNTIDSAWIIVGTKIYDATSYIQKHPGGIDSILKCSGGQRDCTNDFYFHSKHGQAMFAKHYIGQLIPCNSISHDSNSTTNTTKQHQSRTIPTSNNNNTKKEWWMIW